MTTTLTIFGASDDLIEVVGLIYEEYPAEEPATIMTVSIDGERYAWAGIRYDEDGVWRITDSAPRRFWTVVPARGEDEGDDADGCPGYSDKAVFDCAGIARDRITITVGPPVAARIAREVTE